MVMLLRLLGFPLFFMLCQRRWKAGNEASSCMHRLYMQSWPWLMHAPPLHTGLAHHAVPPPHTNTASQTLTKPVKLLYSSLVNCQVYLLYSTFPSLLSFFFTLHLSAPFPPLIPRSQSNARNTCHSKSCVHTVSCISHECICRWSLDRC